MPTRSKPSPNGDGAAVAPGPPPLPTLDAEAFRRKLAGLADPSSGAGALTPAIIKDLAIRFVSILAKLFSDDLKRETLWERIGSALATADAKTGGDDTDAFVSLCLEHVKADAGHAAACEPLGAVMGTLNRGKTEDRSAFLAYLRLHRYAALVHGRERWQLVLKKEAEL